MSSLIAFFRDLKLDIQAFERFINAFDDEENGPFIPDPYFLTHSAGRDAKQRAVELNDACRAAGTRVIMTDTFGLFGAIVTQMYDGFVGGSGSLSFLAVLAAADTGQSAHYRCDATCGWR